MTTEGFIEGVRGNPLENGNSRVRTSSKNRLERLRRRLLETPEKIVFERYAEGIRWTDKKNNQGYMAEFL